MPLVVFPLIWRTTSPKIRFIPAQMARFPAFSHYALNAAIFMVVRQALIKYFYINPVGLWELKSLLVFSPPPPGCWTRTTRGHSSRRRRGWGNSTRRTTPSTSTSPGDAKTANWRLQVSPIARGKGRPATPSHTTKPCIWSTMAGLDLPWVTCTTTTITTTILLVGGSQVQILDNNSTHNSKFKVTLIIQED